MFSDEEEVSDTPAVDAAAQAGGSDDDASNTAGAPVNQDNDE